MSAPARKSNQSILTQKVFSPKYRVIQNARDILADTENWVRIGAFADKDGNQTGLDDPRAARFSAIGAVEKAVTDLYGPIYSSYKHQLYPDDPEYCREVEETNRAYKARVVFHAVTDDLDKFTRCNFWPHRNIIDLNISEDFPDPRLCFIEICNLWLSRNS